MVVPVNPVGIVPGIAKPLDPQAFYVVTYQLGVSSFIQPELSDWPLTPAPPRLDQTWTWRQVHMLGRDVVPGEQSLDLPPRAPQRLPFYGTEWRQVGMLGRDQVPGEQFYDRPPLAAPRLPLYTWEWRQVDKLGLDKLPTGQQVYDRLVLQPFGAGQTWVLNLLETTLAPVTVTGPLGVIANQYDWPLTRAPGRIDETWVWNQTPMLGQDVLPENQYDWPLPRAPYRIEQTWTWRQVGMLGQDQLPVGQQSFDLTPKSTPRSSYYGTEWRQTGYLGQDRLPTGEQVTDLTTHRYIAFRIDQTWVWRQVGMLGKDVLPTGDQIYDLTPKPPQRLSLYSWEWRQVGMLGQDRLPIGQQVYDRPMKAPLRAIDLYSWVQSVNIALTTVVQLPRNQYDWPVPRAPQQSAPSWTWRQVDKIGLDQLPVGEQIYDLPVRGLRLAVYDWIQSVNLALTVPPGQTPLNQYDWPLPRAPQQPTLSWTWNQTPMLGKDRLPRNQYDWPLPNRGPFQPDRSFTFRSSFIPPPPPLPFNQYDWQVPRSAFQFNRSFIFNPPVGPAPPPPFVGASYFLLQPHYIKDAYLQAWTIVTEGIELPIGWIPTLMVDPLNAEAVNAFYTAGPRTGYQGPGYDWQSWQRLSSQRQAAIQTGATHWEQVAPGQFQLTGLGSGYPPRGD